MGLFKKRKNQYDEETYRDPSDIGSEEDSIQYDEVEYDTVEFEVVGNDPIQYDHVDYDAEERAASMRFAEEFYEAEAEALEQEAQEARAAAEAWEEEYEEEAAAEEEDVAGEATAEEEFAEEVDAAEEATTEEFAEEVDAAEEATAEETLAEVEDVAEEAAYYEEEISEDGEYYEEEAPEDGEYYEEEISEDGEYYEEEISEGGEYYEEEAPEDGEYYEEEAPEDGEYYEEEAPEDGAYYEDEEYYEEDELTQESLDEPETYVDESLTEEDAENEGGFAAWFTSGSFMDKVTIAAGICILVLAAAVGVVFLQGRNKAAQTNAFAEVGTQIDGIEVVGDQGLLAVADATIARQEAMRLAGEETSESTEYTEVAYNQSVTVTLKMVSVQKDLKIKFVNKSSSKLVPNVPFSVTVTTADNKTETWSDDDMDGIIYKKGITPGNYKVSVNALTDEKYAKYTLPTGEEKVEVKKDIAYQKIDVSDEVKTEAEINVATEEQKKQEPAVESSLEDTVEWVASTAVTSTYVEVGKSSITDPLTISLATKFWRVANEVQLNHTSAELNVGDTLELSVSHELENVISMGFGSSDNSIAEVDADGVIKAVAAGTAQITCTVTVGKEVDGETREISYVAVCEVTVAGQTSTGGTGHTEGSISISPASLSISEDGEGTAQISASGFSSDSELSYSASSSDDGIATVSVDKTGKVTVYAVNPGTATITVSANYSEDPIENAPTAQLKVTVLEAGSFSLDKTSATVYVGSSATINAVMDSASAATVTAKSSDKSVATVSVNGKAITVTGVEEGTVKITVTATVGDKSSSETCAVTVKKHPKNDTTTLLKDNSGNQLYVQEGDNTYREAVYADYYKDGVKFFKKGETKYTGWQTIDGNVYFFDKNGKKVTGEQVIQGARYTFASDGALVSGSGTMGIDVSKHNATIDWNAVKNSGVSFVIIRCGYRGYTQGSLVIDPKFEQNIRGANAAGLKVGVYFFSQAVDEVEAVQEASFVLDAVRGYKISYPIYLDVEYSGASRNSGRADGLDKATRTAVCKAFCATIRSGGYTAGVYANKSWLETMLDPGQLSSYKIWLAQYAAKPTYGGRYDMWQYKSTGRVSGITGNVDMNISYLGY